MTSLYYKPIIYSAEQIKYAVDSLKQSAPADWSMLCRILLTEDTISEEESDALWGRLRGVISPLIYDGALLAPKFMDQVSILMTIKIMIQTLAI